MDSAELCDRAEQLITRTLEYIEHKVVTYRQQGRNPVCAVVDLSSRFGYALAIDDGEDRNRVASINEMVRDAQTEQNRDAGYLAWNLIVADPQTMAEKLLHAAERTQTISPALDDIIKTITTNTLPVNRNWVIAVIGDPDDAHPQCGRQLRGRSG